MLEIIPISNNNYKLYKRILTQQYTKFARSL